MPAGLFDPEFDPAQPLVQPPSVQKGNKWKELAPLLVAALTAAKTSGRVGVAGLLQGFQQSRQQQMQDDRQAGIDAENRSYRDATLQNQRDQIAASEQAKKDAAANAEATRRQQFLTQYGAGFEGLDTPEAVQAYVALQQAQGRTIGVDPNELARLAPTPAALSQKRAAKALEKLQKARPDDWMNWSVKVDGQDVKAADLLGLSRDPKAPAADAPDLTKSGLDVQAAAALAKGDTETYNRLLKVKKEMGQADDRPRITVNTGDVGDLPPRVQAAVRPLASQFDSLPIVKTIQKQAEAVSFADSLDPNTKNPADDQALIYAFAKAMDPDSVVREGEYATVQKYAQSWAESFGFNAARIFSNTTFLTPQARANMKATIRQRYQAGLGQYNNVRKSFGDRINKITRKGDGLERLTDYAAGFPAQAQTPANAPAAPAPTTKTKIGRFEVEVSQ